MTSAERNRDAYNIWAASYDSDRPPHTYLEEPHFVKLVAAAPGDFILDAACGTGRYSRIFLNHGARVTGCDISEKMLQVALAKNPEALFQVADLNATLPFPAEFFSKAICSLAIGHIENLQGFVSEVARVLRPQGRFVFSTIHPDMNWKSYERAKPPQIEVNQEAANYNYSIAVLEKALSKAGLVTQDTLEIHADATIKRLLTEPSFRAQDGGKFVFLFSACKA